MKSQNIRIEKMTPIRLFTLVSSIGIVSFLLFSVVFGHISFQWLCMTNNPQYMFLDYFKHVLYTADPAKLYENATREWGCFPPFIYMIYYLLYHMTSFLGLTPEHWRDLMAVEQALTVFMYYSIFVATSMLLSIQLWQKKSGAVKLFICLIQSAPFFAGFERGNSIMLVFVMLLVVLKWRDDESHIKREMALILIAICAAIKIYPAIFGFLYIKDRRYKEGCRLLAYGVLFFFFPFVFFGGFNGFLHWLSNVSNTLIVFSIGRIEYIRGLVMTAAYLLTNGASTGDYLSLVLPNLFLIFLLSLFFASSCKYRAIFYLCAIMTFCPSNAFRYTLCYLAIPLIMFLMEHGDDSLSDKFLIAEVISFALLFTIPTLFGFFTNFNGLAFEKNPHLTYVELRLYMMAYVVLGMIVVHELIELFKYKRIDENLLRRIGK